MHEVLTLRMNSPNVELGKFHRVAAASREVTFGSEVQPRVGTGYMRTLALAALLWRIRGRSEFETPFGSGLRRQRQLKDRDRCVQPNSPSKRLELILIPNPNSPKDLNLGYNGRPEWEPRRTFLAASESICRIFNVYELYQRSSTIRRIVGLLTLTINANFRNDCPRSSEISA
ncbi:hypothetical protein ALC53_09224 [Atta colombica]|uniref:Uncharacterized protein n=1 Tax=Atta colombica TaxID=520822 RepID=A0A195B798_9HYME|nr:hypothetical protein ALC53_09224 [Atta colombica]